MQSVRTTLTKRDIARALFARLARPKEFIKAWALWTVVFGIFLVFIQGAPHSLVDLLVILISASIGAPISVGASLAFVLMRVQHKLKDGDGILGDHEYEITDEGLRERTSVNETLVSWRGIKSVVRLKRFAFIELVNGSFHIIPASSFKSSEEHACFLNEVQRCASREQNI